jgi:hypothetical protein
MSWLFSQALVAEYSAANSSAGAPSAPSSTTPTPPAFLWRDKTTDAWSRFPSGMTCEPLTDDRGKELLTWFREGFLAPTSALPSKTRKGLRVKRAASGPKWPESLAKWDRDTSSWKTAQRLLFADSVESLETFPRWGLMRGGELLAQTPVDFNITEPGSGWLPTPTATDGKGGTTAIRADTGKQRTDQLRHYVKIHFGVTYPNPSWLDEVMGFPTDWTALAPVATPKFQQWLRSHGVSSADPDSTQPHTC